MPIDDVKIETFGFTRDDIKKLARDEIKDIAAKVVDEAIDDGRINIEDNVKEILEADKNIISQIEVEYDEDGELTFITFPSGIIPLSITLNTHRFYFKDNNVVDNNGEEVEGYDLDEIIIEDNECHLAFNGDLSEQVINGLSYIQYNGDSNIISNTYNLFYPASGGTKLYLHTFTVSATKGTDELTGSAKVICDSATPFTDWGDLHNMFGYIVGSTKPPLSMISGHIAYTYKQIDFEIVAFNQGPINPKFIIKYVNGYSDITDLWYTKIYTYQDLTLVFGTDTVTEL